MRKVLLLQPSAWLHRTWIMLMRSLVSDGSDRAPTATVAAMLRSWKRTSVVAMGAPTLRRNHYITHRQHALRGQRHGSKVSTSHPDTGAGVQRSSRARTL